LFLVVFPYVDPRLPFSDVTVNQERAGRVQAIRILVIDNYDSFVYNLVHYLAQLGAEPTVRRNDEMAPTDLDGFDGVLTSPGPSTPESAGVSVPVVAERARRRLPLFGVCLGHQAIAVAFGATVTRAGELLHGKTSEVHHKGEGALAVLPGPV